MARVSVALSHGNQRQQADQGGRRQRPAEPDLVRDHAHQDRADDRAAVLGHLECRQHAAAAAVGADDIGDRGLLGRVDESGAETRDGGEHEQHPQAAAQTQQPESEGGHGEAGDRQRAATDRVRQPSRHLEAGSGADCRDRERDAGDPRTVVDGEGELGQDRHPDPEVAPPVGEGRSQRGPVGRAPQRLPQQHGRSLGPVRRGLQAGPAQAYADHGRRDDQRRGVHEEGEPEVDRREQPPEQRTQHAADEEGAGVGRGDPAADGRWRQPHHQGHRGDREHRRAEAPEPTKDQQLPVGLGEGGGQGGHRHHEQAGEVDRSLAEPRDQGATGRGEHEPEEGEDRDDQRGCGDADIEAACVRRQDRSDQTEADRDHERRADEHPDLTGDRRPPGRPCRPFRRGHRRIPAITKRHYAAAPADSVAVARTSGARRSAGFAASGRTR